MEAGLLERLADATTDAEREAIVLEMSLSGLSTPLQAAVSAAAIPHWFDALFLEALLGAESDALYDELVGLSFVEQTPGRGYAIHERTRKQLLRNLWRDAPDRFHELSGRAAAYCTAQAAQTNAPDWQAEAIYHWLVSDPDRGVAGLRGLATRWANYEYHTYEEIERVVRLANEQIEAGRLSGPGVAWTRLWQAKLALIYGRPDLAAAPLSQIINDSITDPALAAEVAQTQGDLLAEQGDRAGMEAAWRSAYERYRQLGDSNGRLDAYLVADRMRQHGLSDPEAVVDTGPKRPPSANALRLIDNIAAAWIEGVLQTAVDETIDLSMARDGRRPSNLLFHRPQGIDRPVATGQRLSRLFAAAGESLLILGAPGSGKTITLLQLLDELLQQAQADGSAPIPLLFNLSSFAPFALKHGNNLTDWLADQAYKQYRLKRQTTRDGLADNRFILLLDGLDEVANKEGMGMGMREQCVVAINQFMQASPCGLVVCSRIGDYQALQSQLALAHALVLQPLANRQIAAFINEVEEPQRTAMWQQIKADWQLQEALRSPLLLNLYPQAFPVLNLSPEATGLPATGTVETRRKALFAAYINAIFSPAAQNGGAASPGKEAPLNDEEAGRKARSLRWLSFLARRMQQAGTTVFFVEELQPTWLPQHLLGRYRGLYGLLLGLIDGLIGGLIFVLIGGLIAGPTLVLFYALLGALIGGLSGGCGGVISVWFTTKIGNSWLKFGSAGLFTWIILGLAVGLIGSLTVDTVIVVLFIGPGLSVSIGIASLAFDIQLRERVRLLQPSRERLRYYMRQSALYGLIGGLLLGLITSLIAVPGTLSFRLIISLVFTLLVGFIGGLVAGLIGVLVAFIDSPTIDERPFPASGVRASLRNALFMTTLAALCLGVSAWLIDQTIEADFILLFFLLVNITPPIFTWFGGLAWCQHWALRLILSRRDWLPRQLVPWLNEMTARGLLRRVGGGYIFIHRSLLEYLATLEET